MQQVKIYYNLADAALDMEEYIHHGWRVHTCTMGTYVAGYSSKDHVLVVYEKEN